MVLPSVPLFLDPPTWNQLQQVVHEQQQQTQLVVQPHPSHPDAGNVGPSPGSIRPNSMADRARLLKIPQPEEALKCPRCNSNNTKFCYFNNYSLSQPRHFCKACRRYWTCGGALRNVPVGGSCRRNKHSNKSSSSKTSGDRQAGAATSSTTTTSAGTSTVGLATPAPQLPFMASLHHMIDYNSVPPNLGLGFSGMQAMDPIQHFQKIQHFPFLGGLEHQLPRTSIYPNFDGVPTTGSELVTQMESVKMEDNNSSRGLNLARQYNLAINNNISSNNPIWGGGHGGECSSTDGGGSGGGGWMANLPGFNSSSTGSIL